MEEIVDELRDYDERFGIILYKHLVLLRWWCFLNLIAGIGGLLFSQGWLSPSDPITRREAAKRPYSLLSFSIYKTRDS